jgi:N,N'-diacetylbacillosaminyl-diphospho-undecaprenol alpha-1,3-N-acetylgalactosaminyltransferase
MRAILVLNDAFSMWHFRRGLIRALVERGVEVIVVTPGGPDERNFETIGAQHIRLPMKRFISPAADLSLAIRFYRLCRRLRPDVVHTMTVKPNLFAAPAARLAGVKTVVGLVSGLGFGLMPQRDGWGARLTKAVTTVGYRLAGYTLDRIWFQHQDDANYFISHRLLAAEKTVVIRSGGINLEDYSPAIVSAALNERVRRELSVSTRSVLVIMAVARVVWSKGVREFVESAERICAQHQNCEFRLFGAIEPDSPDAVPESYLRTIKNRAFRWVGFQDDLKPILSAADIVVLPSYYAEGVPRVLLEALAIGKPIITTSHPGCREVVDDGRNGSLVAPKSVDGLQRALASLVDDEERRQTFGRQSRLKAEAEFGEREVTTRVIEELYGLTNDRTTQTGRDRFSRQAARRPA